MYQERLQLGRQACDLAWSLSRRPEFAWLDDSTGKGWSYLASDPVEVIQGELMDAGALLSRHPTSGRAAVHSGHDGVPTVPQWLGYIDYDAAVLRPQRGATAGGPGAAVLGAESSGEEASVWWGRYDAVLALQHTTGAMWLVGDDERACRRLQQRLDVEEAVRRSARLRFGPVRVAPAEQHRHAIRQALDFMRAGELYQINLARRWQVEIDGTPLLLWERWRRRSPAPLGLYLQAGPRTVMANTMECFLRWEGPGDGLGGDLISRPIKGTLARHVDDSLSTVEHRLRGDAKEHAEHSMIVDLVRNDLGRVAVPGTVEVRQWMAVEAYAQLYHLVSTVGCRTAEAVSLVDVLAATFPPGSVTGAPKLRALDLIAALEPCSRGLYTGCVGYLDRRGGAHLAVAIRTAVAQRGQLSYFAGGGIVLGSDPDREVAETELKARGFLESLRGD